MKKYLEKLFHCKVITYVGGGYYSFVLNSHVCNLVLSYPQSYYSKTGCDYYTLWVDRKMAVRKGRFEDCITYLIRLSDPVTR